VRDFEVVEENVQSNKASVTSFGNVVLKPVAIATNLIPGMLGLLMLLTVSLSA
jgi:hypothetical protein